LGQLWDIQGVSVSEIYIEFLEMRCVDPGNEVFHILHGIPKVEVGKSGENSERRRISTRPFQEGFRMEWKAADIEVFELGCCGQRSGEDLW